MSQEKEGKSQKKGNGDLEFFLKGEGAADCSWDGVLNLILWRRILGGRLRQQSEILLVLQKVKREYMEGTHVKLILKYKNTGRSSANVL